MTTIRQFHLDDLFRFNHITFDPLVEVYSLCFFVPKLLKHPELALSAVGPHDRLTGFILGCRFDDDEDGAGDGKDSVSKHGHISALAVAHEYRRLGLATILMDDLRGKMERSCNWYLDLFVRQRNLHAIRLYESLGYVKYRWLPQFYADDHGYDMRLPLSLDVD
ncbi:hypothetical protein KR018_010868, partial [Drosophila ironensis]